ERIGEFPMPIDLLVTYTDGTSELYYIPMNETLGNKPAESKTQPRVDLETWPWVNPTYTLKINKPVKSIAKLEIDPSMCMADINRKNNLMELAEEMKAYEDPTRK